jgi:threonine/homoserine/homoserine lactone efflux protein
MIESLVTLSIAGLLTGFIFSMPIAGPISILIASNALAGKLRYCYFASLGASIVDFFYMFTAVYGLTKLYSYFEPAKPYIYAAGCVLFILLGYKIYRTKTDLGHLEDKHLMNSKIGQQHRGGFYTGFMINALNPTLIIGAVTSSFFVITFVSSLGFHTGGLDMNIDRNRNVIISADSGKTDNVKDFAIKKFEDYKERKRKEHQPDQTSYPSFFHILISICFAFFLALGNIIWLSLMAFLIVRYRQRLNIMVITGLIKGLGILLFLLGVYFGFLALGIFLPR